VKSDTLVFTSLLIGLMSGVQTITVESPPSLGVVRVDYLLDGRRAASASTGDPWRADVNLGELSPHVLAAVGLDHEGREVARTERLVNLPEPPARLEILVVRNGLGQPVAARLVATSTLRDTPLRYLLTLDGQDLEVDADGRAPLPAADVRVPHVLSASAVFADDVVAHAAAVIGGAVQDESGSRLTAVPVRVKTRLLPSIDSLSNVFTCGGLKPRVVAIERGRATVVMVRNPSSLEADQRLRRPLRDDQLKLETRDSVGFVWPLTKTLPGGSEKTTLLESTPFFPGSAGGFFWFLTRVSRQGVSSPPYRLADAVAVAGLRSYAESSRRAVVLVQGKNDGVDDSQFSTSQVRSYLRAIGTPLHIWSLSPSSKSTWLDQAQDIGSNVGLQAAVTRLRQDLGTQGVVWLSGEWSPSEVDLAPSVSSIALLTHEGAQP
jgi:hypothetical protein